MPLLPVRLAGKDGNRGVSPVLMNYLANDCQLDVQGISAILLSLAAKGRCRLAGSDRAGYSDAAVDPGPGAQLDPLTLEDVFALDELPRTAVRLDDDDPDRWNGILRGCRQALREEYGGLFRRAPLLRFIGFAVPLFLAAAIQLWHTQNLRLFGPAWPSFPWEAFLQLCALIVSGWGLSLAVPRQKALDSWKAWLTGLGVFLAAAGLLAALFLPLPLVREVIQSPFSAILPDATILQRACFFGSLLWPLFFGSLMQSRTEELAELQGQIAGFAKYIASADASRLQALNPPGENLAEYCRLLPYACALGLEEAWTRRFERDLAAAGEGSSASADSAPWGFPLGSFSPAGFAQSVRNCTFGFNVRLFGSDVRVCLFGRGAGR